MLRRVQPDEVKPVEAAPRAPFIEIGIYRESTSDSATFAESLHALNDLGAKPTGEIMVWPQRHRFASITDTQLEPRRMNPEDVLKHVEAISPFTLQVRLSGFFPEESVLTYLAISRRAALASCHPIGLWVSGADVAYEPVLDTNQGSLAREALLLLVRRVRPSYGAITIDYPLECPCDLAQNEDSEAFSDFFLQDGYLDSAALHSALKPFDGAYSEHIEDGLFVSSTPMFNPAGIRLADSLERSKAVARAIGGKCSRAYAGLRPHSPYGPMTSELS